MRNDRGRDSSGHSSNSSISLSAIRKSAHDSISHASGSKTTTITPILGNHGKPYGSAISEVIDLVDSDNDSSRTSPHPRGYHGGVVPNMKKRKLDILRQGGLEVTAISNRNGPMGRQHHGTPASSLLAATGNVSKINGSKVGASLPGAQMNVPTPRFQSSSMYMRTSTIFGNPKELSHPEQPTEYNCIDLSVEKCNPALRIRLPESTTIQKAHTFSPFATGQKLTDPNLQITLVPPLQSAHNSHNYTGTKRKASDNGKSSTSSSSSLSAIASLSGPSGSGGDRTTVTPLPPGLIPAALLSAVAANNSSANADNRLLPPPAILNVPNMNEMNEINMNQLFLQRMLDPMYLNNFYNNPNLIFQQPLPPEVVLQGMGVIPISKS